MRKQLNFCALLKMQGKDIFSLFSAMIDESGVGNRAEAFELIRKREELGPTAIGGGVAVPHAKIPGLEAPCVVVGIPEETVEYSMQDIRMIVMILLPESGSSSNVELMSSLVSAVSTEEGRRRVLAAKSKDEVEEVFLG